MDNKDLNLKVAAIAGWTDIELWNEKALKQTLVGTNLAHPEMGIFVPDYTSDLNAIVNLFVSLNIGWQASTRKNEWATAKNYNFGNEKIEEASTLSLALCKLLVALDPEPIKLITKKDEAVS